MKSNEHINKLAEDALNSLDGAGRAVPKPYLFTRLNARMRNEKETIWDNALKFINRPAIALAGLCLVIAVNTFVLTAGYSEEKTTTVSEEQYASVDEYSSAATVLNNDIENIEP